MTHKAWSNIEQNILSAMHVDWDPPHLSPVACYILQYITPTRSSSMQELIKQGMEQKL